MSAARMAELALKKSLLRQRSEVLRLTLAIQLGDTLAPAAGVAERAASTGRWVRRHSLWLVAGLAALLVYKPKTLPNLAGRAMWAWQTWQRWQPIVLPLVLPLMAHFRAAAAAASASASPDAPSHAGEPVADSEPVAQAEPAGPQSPG